MTQQPISLKKLKPKKNVKKQPVKIDKKVTGKTFIKNFLDNHCNEYITREGRDEYSGGYLVFKKIDLVLHTTNNLSPFQPRESNNPKTLLIPVIIILGPTEESDIYKLNAGGIDVLVDTDHNNLIKKLRDYTVI